MLQTVIAPETTFHILRHSWATWFASSEKDLIRLKTLGGWSSLKMVERYAKLAPRGLAADLNALGWNFAGDLPPTKVVETEARES